MEKYYFYYVNNLKSIVKITMKLQFSIKTTESGFSIGIGDVTIINHSLDHPFLYVGNGETQFINIEGHFDIRDRLEQRIGVKIFEVDEDENQVTIVMTTDDNQPITIQLVSTPESQLEMKFAEFPTAYDRLCFRLQSNKDEFIYGGGEQFTHFNLKGYNFPIWIREQGIGRDPKSPISFFADVFANGKGGSYDWTYFPQATFVSSQRYYCHVGGSRYMELDFTQPDQHEVYILGKPESVYFNSACCMESLLGKLTEFFKRQQPLPTWLNDGVIIGTLCYLYLCLLFSFEYYQFENLSNDNFDPKF